MTEKLYSLKQVSAIGNHSAFVRGGILLGENITMQTAQRIGKALVAHEDNFAAQWAERGGSWYKGNSLVIECKEMPEPDNMGYLQEALLITGDGDRERDYGHPIKNFSAIGLMWTVYLTVRNKLMHGMEVDHRDVAAMMILMKVAREANTSKRDNWVDMAGYVNTMWRMQQVEKEEGEKPNMTMKQRMFGWLRR
jgi:hypothetical protein